jgi:PAS domain S-box-containing protein
MKANEYRIEDHGDKPEKPVTKNSNEHTEFTDKLDGHLISQLKLFSKIAGLISIIIGFTVLVGWALNIDVLKSILPNIISMKANTALCFILIGIALILLTQKKINTRTIRIVQICAVIISIIGLLTIIEYLFNINLGIDQILFKETVGAVLTINPGRMAVITAINFLLIGLGVLIINLNNKFRINIYQLFTLIAGIISLFSFLGYIYGSAISYSAIPTPMALNTSITFIIVILGLLFLHPDQGVMATLTSTSMGGVMARRLIPLTIILLIIIGLFHIIGEYLGFYNAATGVALIIIMGVIILSFLILNSATSINRIDLDRKKAEEELKESEELYREFFDNPLNGYALCEILTDDTGNPEDFVYLEVNRAFEDFTGLKREDVINKKATEIFPYKEIAELIQIYGKVAVTGKSANFQYPIPSLDKYYNISTFSPKNKQFIAFFTDITESKKADEALKESEEKLRTLVESLPVGISILDKDRNVIYDNPALERILDLTKEGLLKGKYAGREYVKSDMTEISLDELPSVKAFNEQKTAEDVEVGVIKEDNSIIWTNVSAIPLSFPDWRVLIVTSNITERKKAEEYTQKLLKNEKQLTAELQTSNEELMQIQHELTKTINKLATSNEELEQFAYVASHDLQEPLRMVGSFTQLLEKRYKDQLDEDADDYIGFIVDGANRMKDLIDDLLAFSRLNTEAKEFELTELENALDDVLFNLEIVIEENNATIIRESLPSIRCDSSQIKQLFQNLIVNAIKFHSDKSPEINISSHDAGKEWLFGVSDNGIGIDVEHQKKIFDVFRRLHTRDEFEGTGIGLAICKRIVERHGGRIWVESEPGKGSTFYFTIPK